MMNMECFGFKNKIWSFTILKGKMMETKGINTQMILGSPEVRLYPQGISATNLWLLVEDYMAKKIVLPPHQRENDVWDKYKKQGYRKRIISSEFLGTVLTYQLYTDHRTFLNDGLQRVSNSIDFYQNASSYGYNPENVKDMLKSFQVGREHHHYKEHYGQAFLDFQQVNFGTSMTAQESGKGELCYTKLGPSIFEEILHPLVNDVIFNISSKACDAKHDMGRKSIHKLIRDCYSICLRYLKNDEYRYTQFNSGISSIAELYTGRRGTSPEEKLRDVINRKYNNKAELVEDLKKIKKFIIDETAIIMEVWFHDLSNKIGNGISKTLYFFLINQATLRISLNISLDQWVIFLKELLKLTKGTAIISKESKHKKERLLTLGLGSPITKLSRVHDLINIKCFLNNNKTYRKNKTLTIEGFDSDHIKPFSKYGDGETTALASKLNKSKGNKED